MNDSIAARQARSPEGAPAKAPDGFRSAADLFLVSLLLLFLELACIRWFPAHVLYLTFFTNTVLLACFLGMSVGCLTSGSRRSYLAWTPFLLALTMLAGLSVELLRLASNVDVGGQQSPQVVFFGTETLNRDIARFVIPVEVLGGIFFLLIALIFLGPGQELGRAFDRMSNRVAAYTVNILGSLVGIMLFAGFSWRHLPPLCWFVPICVGLAYFLVRAGLVRSKLAWAAGLALVMIPALSSLTSVAYKTTEHTWSPYYRIDYEQNSRLIWVNLIGHQIMESRTDLRPSYALPHLLHRDSRQEAGLEPRRFRQVLIIGAGSGNDVSRALEWGATRVDAVEIDPVIQSLGARDHPDRPYDDPRVVVHLDDGRNFLRSAPDKEYDLIIYALVDSLVLHSSYSNLRLESYLFTDQAFADVRRCLRPDGMFVMYNFFRQGWIVSRLYSGVVKAFQTEPLVMALPYRSVINPEQQSGGFTVFMAGSDDALSPFQHAFARYSRYWLAADKAPGLDSPNGFREPGDAERKRWDELPDAIKNNDSRWREFGLAVVEAPAGGQETAHDDWPFLYLRSRLLPALTLWGMAIMAGIAGALLWWFYPRPVPVDAASWSSMARMFFLGAGFMLVETKAVVHMALLFGSTWMVNSVVFMAVLVMILAANLWVLRMRPARLAPYYVALVIVLLVNALVPLDFFLGLPRSVQVGGACLLVFAPILFAGVIFAVSFSQSASPGRDLGANIAGAMLGGLSENISLLTGFRYLLLVALAFYLLSALARQRRTWLPETGKRKSP
jgi:SAM-dependent methyltransferase